MSTTSAHRSGRRPTTDLLSRPGVANSLTWTDGELHDIRGWEPGGWPLIDTRIACPPTPGPDGDQFLTSPAFTPIRTDEPQWPTTTAGVALRNLYVTRGERALLELPLWDAWLFDRPLL